MQYTLTPAFVHSVVADLLITALKLGDYKRSCPVQTLIQVVLCACARLVSLTAAARSLLRAACPETIRTALHAQLPEPDELQKRFNRGFRFGLPSARNRRRRLYWLAVDYTLVPYHGQPARHAHELYRGQPKSGTTHFHAYATLCIIERGSRYTVAVRWVQQKAALAEVVQ